jgi:hypothetical protein
MLELHETFICFPAFWWLLHVFGMGAFSFPWQWDMYRLVLSL